MNIVNNLVLGVEKSEQKFVVIVLSNGDVYFCTMPLYGERNENRHKDIVAKFCKEKGFTPKLMSNDAIVTAINREKIKLEVDGGGLVRHHPDSKSVSSCIKSGDYGKPLRSIVEHCLQEAMNREGLDGYEVDIDEVREK